MAKTSRIGKLIDRLAEAESEFLSREFLAPVLRDGEVRVRIAGVVCRMRIEPADFEGWGVFRPADQMNARLVRQAGLAERRRYLELMPVVRMILCRRVDRNWNAIAAHRGDTRFQIDGVVPMRLQEDGQLFDIVRTRFDGTNFWFDSLDSRRDPATAAYLRDSLERSTEPDKLDRRGLTSEERAAYALNYFARQKAREVFERNDTEARLRQALRHAGAKFVGFVEHRDGYRVTYSVGQQRHVSSVNKHDLTVQVAGICLSGEDRKFDLSSLVGVLREAGGNALPVGRDNGGMEEGEYWQVHPAQR